VNQRRTCTLMDWLAVVYAATSDAAADDADNDKPHHDVISASI